MEEYWWNLKLNIYLGPQQNFVVLNVELMKLPAESITSSLKKIKAKLLDYLWEHVLISVEQLNEYSES